MKQVNKAIASVMSEVRRQEAKDKNKYADYKYTSVDDYKDHLRPIMAKHGLAIRSDQLSLMTEELTSKSGKTIVARFDLAFWLAHESGEEEHPERITVMLPFVGAQTTGQARSYAQKEWLKSKFLASSGDRAEEADALPQSEYTRSDEAPETPSGRPTWEPDKPGAAYKGSILIHPGTPPGKSGMGPSAYSVKDSSVWKQLDAQDNLDSLDAWYAKKETQDEKSRLPWGHQIELFERVIKRGADVAESVPALMAFLDGYDDLLKALKEVDGVRYQSLVEHVLIARKAIKERSSENAQI